MTADLNKGQNVTNRLKAMESKEVFDEKQLDKAAGGFEALLLHQMLKSMWATVESNGLLGENSHQGKMYRDMFNQAIADKISEGKGIGVKQFLRRELIRAEAASKGQGTENKELQSPVTDNGQRHKPLSIKG